MSIDRRRTHLGRRAARLLWPALFAALGLAIAATPALAAVTPAPASSWRTIGADAALGPGLAPQALLADTSPAPSAAAPASPSPAPSASAAPSPSPSSSPAPSATPVPTPQPTPAWSKVVATVGDSIRFYGRGNGHGVGMSQWGARGRALAGQTATTILSAYFAGTSIGATAGSREVRVLLMSGYAGVATAPLLLYGRTGSWTIDGVATPFPANASLSVWRTSALVNGVTVWTWHLRVKAADGVTVLYNGTRSGSSTAVIRPASSTSRLQVFTKPSYYDLFRGRLTLLLRPTYVTVINAVALDDYLKGVVPVEMPATWPTESLQAQAIVARSWAVRHLHPTTGTFDVYDDGRSQVYRGVRAEVPVVNALLAARPGAVLFYGTTVADAFYSSAAGGWTENNEDSFVTASGSITSAPLPYLRGHDDRAPNGTAYDAGAPGFSWTTTVLTHAQLNAILAADVRTSVGTVLRLDLTHRGASGRLFQVVIYGSTATKTVSGDVFRAVYNAHRPAGTQTMLSDLFDAAPLP